MRIEDEAQRYGNHNVAKRRGNSLDSRRRLW